MANCFSAWWPPRPGAVLLTFFLGGTASRRRDRRATGVTRRAGVTYQPAASGSATTPVFLSFCVMRVGGVPGWDDGRPNECWDPSWGMSQPSTANIGRVGGTSNCKTMQRSMGPRCRDDYFCLSRLRGKACNCGGWDGDGSLGPIYCPSVISSCHADRASRGQRARAPTVHANSVPSSSKGGW